MQRELADRLRGIEEERHQAVARPAGTPKRRWRRCASACARYCYEATPAPATDRHGRPGGAASHHPVVAAAAQDRAPRDVAGASRPPGRGGAGVGAQPGPGRRAALAVDERGEAEVQVGSSMRLAASDLEGRRRQPPEAAQLRWHVGIGDAGGGVSLELDLRGYRAEEVDPCWSNTSTTPTWAGCPSCASSTARARACCARWCARSGRACPGEGVPHGGPEGGWRGRHGGRDGHGVMTSSSDLRRARRVAHLVCWMDSTIRRSWSGV